MSWPWRRSIEIRIMAVMGGLLTAVLILLNAGMAYLLAKAELEETANHLQIQALIAARNLQDPLSSYSGELKHLEEDEDEDDEKEGHEQRQGPQGREASLLPSWASSLSQSTGAKVLVSDLNGQVLAGQGHGPQESEIESARKGEPLHRWTGSTIFASVPVMGPQGRPIGLVRLAIPRIRATARSGAMSLALILVSLSALLLALLAAANLSRRLVRPLRQLEERVNEAASGNWNTRVEVDGQDELASLSRAFASMLAELHNMLERQRLFVAHASHELRTPLTRIKLRSEALAAGALHDSEIAERFVRELDAEADRLTRLTDALLDLGRLEERTSTGVDKPLHAVRLALERVRPMVEQRRIQLMSDLPPSLPALTISSEGLDTVLDNLLDNAVKYTPEGGHIHLQARTISDSIELTVGDSGPGISAEHLPHVFERFYRVDATRGSAGFGLGLALVKAAVGAVGGKATVTSPEGGSRFTVRLPLRSID